MFDPVLNTIYPRCVLLHVVLFWGIETKGISLLYANNVCLMLRVWTFIQYVDIDDQPAHAQELRQMCALPCMQRPDELVQSTQTLRDMFANLCGKMPAKDIETLKQNFENQMSNIQFRIATRFVQQLLSYIKQTH